MRKLTLTEMQAVCRGTAAPAGAACDAYGCYPPPSPRPTPRPTPRPCTPRPGVYC